MVDRQASLIKEPAAETSKSLVLTPLQDLKGYLFFHIGRLFLLFITCTSVLAILLILFFILKDAVPFLKARTGTSTNKSISFGKASRNTKLDTYDVKVIINSKPQEPNIISAAYIKLQSEDQSTYRALDVQGNTIKGPEITNPMDKAARLPEAGLEIDIDNKKIKKGVNYAAVKVKRAIGFFFTSIVWAPESKPTKFGSLAIIVDSFYVTIVSVCFAVPIGILAAVFLSDIVSLKIKNIVKPVIELLAAIPSVAYGFFAVLILAPWMQKNLGFSTGVNALNASIILSIMALPTIISVAEDSLSALGRDIREASYSLSATRFETIMKVVIPAAHSGIIAAIVLGMMRAIGETMVVWMASGNASRIPSPWWNLSQSVRTLTATIAGDMAETPKGSDHFHSLFMMGVVLLVFTFFLNSLSEYFLSQAKRKAGRAA